MQREQEMSNIEALFRRPSCLLSMVASVALQSSAMAQTLSFVLGPNAVVNHASILKVLHPNTGNNLVGVGKIASVDSRGNGRADIIVGPALATIPPPK
jgi:hypothetical protein